MITPDSNLLFKKLNKSCLDKVQIIRTPTATVTLADSADNDNVVKFGGYKAIVHYNRDKEIQHRKECNDKRFRQLRKEIKKASCSQAGEELPSLVTHLNLSGRLTR